MTTAKRSPGAKSLAYAENELRVHEVHKEAVEARNKLDTILTDLSEAKDKKRTLEFLLQDAEMEVANDEWSKHPDMAVTRMEKHLKYALQGNDACRELREQIASLQGDVDGLEYDRQIQETDIKIAVARLTELAGYLQYLAAIKLTQPVKSTDMAKSGEA